MNRPDVIYLITENARTHGVHDTVTDEERKVFCTVGSITRSEYYMAQNAGYRPEIMFLLALEEDYQRERSLKYHGQKYRIVRTYPTEDGGIEIYAERSDDNGEETDTDSSDTGNS